MSFTYSPGPACCVVVCSCGRFRDVSINGRHGAAKLARVHELSEHPSERFAFDTLRATAN